MADLDADLLALAGGDDSEGEASVSAQQKEESPVQDTEDGHAESEEEDVEMADDKQGKQRSRPKKAKNEEEAEEGEAEENGELYVIIHTTQ